MSEPAPPEAAQSDDTAHVDPGSPDYLLFRTGDELYACRVAHVHEIRRWEGCTRLPNAPKDVVGVLHMRGQIIPVVEARSRLGLPTIEYNRENVLICLTGVLGENSRNAALLVDGVLRNVALPDIRPTPQWEGQSEGMRYVLGLSEYQEQQVVILDTDRLLCDALSMADELNVQAPGASGLDAA